MHGVPQRKHHVGEVNFTRALCVTISQFSISIYQVQTCEIKPNKMTVEQYNKVRKIL